MRNYLYILLATIASLLFAELHSTNKRTATIAKPLVKSDTVRLVFGGDLMQHLPQVEAAQTDDGGYDYTRSFEHIAPMFRSADIAVVNLETTIDTTGRYSGYPCFASPAELVHEMVDMGIDIALLANNHCCDRGARGIGTTIDRLSRVEIAHTGAYCDSADYAANNVLLVERNNIRFAFINYTYATNGIPTPKGRIVNRIDTTLIKRDIATIKCDSVDCVVACMHWGNEYQRHPSKEQRILHELLRREGVDIVIGSHPHVAQPYEADSTHVVFYSLGNLVSNQQRRYRDGGVIAEIEVVRCDTVEGLRFKTTAHPVWVLCPDYRILPRSVGDTLTMPAYSRELYQRFMEDTEQLLWGDN